MSETEKRRGGLVPFRIPFPNPLAWRPKFGGARKHKRNFASASVAISETLMNGSAGSVLSSAPSAPPSKVALKPASDVLAGALARAASQSTIHPLDTLKVRLQANKGISLKPPGLSKIGQLVPPAAIGAPPPFDFKALGSNVAGLYRGLVGAASGAGIAIGAYFAFYGVACNTLSRHTDMSASAVAFVSGGIAAVGSSFVKVPLAVCIRSVQAGVYPNFFAAAKSITAATGPRGLFTGYAPTVLEDVPDMAIKFAAYESLRQLHRNTHQGRNPSPHEDFIIGAFSGAVAAAATTPLDVIKTNMMCNAATRPSMAGAAALVFQSGGSKAFFRGVGPRALSNGINSAVFFCFFEAFRGAFAAQAHAKKHAAEVQLSSHELVETEKN